MTAPGTLTIATDGPRLTALTWGPADGRPVLCLHGFPDTAWTWRHLGPALAARGHRVIAPFARGYGPSEPAPDGDYRTGTLVADVLAVHDLLGGAPAVLVGHDWGALAAAGAAALAPERWSAVVTLAVPPLPVVVDAVRAARVGLLAGQVVRSWYVAAALVPGLAERTWPWLVRRLWRGWSPGYDPGDDLAHLDAAVDTPARRTAVLSYYRAWARAASFDPHGHPHAAEQEALARVPSCPVLHLHGEQDGCVGVAFAHRARTTLAPGSEVMTLPGAGHFLHLERPDDVLATIVGHLGRRGL